jgi:hypothetical protein
VTDRRDAPSRFWWRQLAPSATAVVAESAAHTAGGSPASAIFVEIPQCWAR